MVRAMVIRAAGTNCDAEMVRGFVMAGASAETVHLDRLIAEPQRLDEVELIGFPGGFSYGDDIASGRVFAMKVRERLWEPLRRAVNRGALVLGACNGFQVLVQVGLLPGPDALTADGQWPDEGPRQTASLTDNADHRFHDRWVGVEFVAGSRCVWTRGLEECGATTGKDGVKTLSPAVREATHQLPVAHGEGRLVAADAGLIARWERQGQVPLRYRENFNGSTGAIAGLCDATGRVFGLMPHPERYLDWTRHPSWTRLEEGVRKGPTPGLMMFMNAVAAAKGAVRGGAVAVGA